MAEQLLAEPILADQAARDAIDRNPGQNMVVVAGAGAGKTHALVGRMVRMVTTGTTDVEHIAAITFTRKAAGELRARFYARLRAARTDATGDDRVHIDRALESFDQCYMGTIHSFCGRILRERPVEAGLPPDFTEIEGRDEMVLRRSAWDRYVQKIIREDDTRISKMEELGLEMEDLYTFFVKRSEYSDLNLKATNVPQPDLETPFKAAEILMREIVDNLPRDLPKGPDDFMKFLDRVQRYLEYNDVETPADRARFLKMFAAKADIKNTFWGEQKAYAKVLRDDIIPTFQETVIEPALLKWRQHAYEYVASIVDDAMSTYDTERHQSGILTFQDLLLKATSLLREFPIVRRFFQQRYRSLLVDEFQDTDPIQAEMVFYLSGDDHNEKDWRRLRPRPGSLFVVGDDKQSIYRFRRADMDIFRFVSERIIATGGIHLQLSTSFRSFDGVCDWINSAFEALSSDSLPEFQAEFTPLIKHRIRPEPVPCVCKLTVETIKGHNRAAIAGISADRIADYIAGAIAQEKEPHDGSGQSEQIAASPGDFLLLTRTRGQLARYARALEERGIPYDISGGGRLGDNKYVRAVTDLIEAAIWPDNGVALACYLRGPLVGLGDDELYDYRRSGGRFDHRVLPAEYDPMSDHGRLERAMKRLERTRDWMATRSPATAVSLIMDDLGVVAYSAGAKSGSSNAGSMIRLQALVHAWENRDMNMAQVAAELVELVSDPEYTSEEMTLEAGSEDVVRIMNIHQAKGLEGRVVFLCDPKDSAADKFEPDVHVSRSSAVPYLALPAYRPKGPYAKEVVAEPVGWADDSETETRFLAAENLRLLYVAATRARDMLVVCRYAGSDDKGPWTQLYPFLEQVPELDYADPQPTKEPVSPAPDWHAIRHSTEKSWRAVKEATYAISAVTSEGPETESLASLGGGKGKDYGTMIHDLFELAVTGRMPKDEHKLVHEMAEDAGMDESLALEAVTALSEFRESAIWAELTSSDSVFAETPFGVAREDRGIATLMRGRIDLIYRVGGGWKMVDYKTDGAQDSETVDALTVRYGPQVTQYADHWQNLTGEDVLQKGLWLTDISQYVPIP
ncbi:MAG: UvrD-helicase domain-containing protein [Candidatus Latescibacteria bacterium]|nr:UvrD-helicase domain-containing protein [Candidatus Latescibacterota bacterium]